LGDNPLSGWFEPEDYNRVLPLGECRQGARLALFHRLEVLVYHGSPRPRRIMTTDETNLNGEWLYLWAAIDVDTKKEISTIHSFNLLEEKAYLNVYISLRKILKACSNKLH
jgi:hypothetical protein